MRVKELREDAGLTQRELADMAGLSHVTVNHIETGKTPPRPWTLRKLAEALGVSIRELREEPKEAMRYVPVPEHIFEALTRR